SPEGFVVRAAVVVAGQAEASRGPQDEERGREDQPGRPPVRPRPEPAVRRVTEGLGGIERGGGRTPEGRPSVEGGPGGINDERRERQRDHERLCPPRVAARRPAEAPVGRQGFPMDHSAPPRFEGVYIAELLLAKGR